LLLFFIKIPDFNLWKKKKKFQFSFSFSLQSRSYRGAVLPPFHCWIQFMPFPNRTDSQLHRNYRFLSPFLSKADRYLPPFLSNRKIKSYRGAVLPPFHCWIIQAKVLSSESNRKIKTEYEGFVNLSNRKSYQFQTIKIVPRRS